MSDLLRWNDDRLDDLNLRVREMSTAVEKVAPLAERVSGLSDDLKETKDAVNGLRFDLTGMVGNPFKEARELRAMMKVGIVSALCGGLATGIIAVATGGFH